MEIFFCTFIIKLQYIKRSKESAIKKGAPSTFEAILKSSKNYIIASGNSRPSLMNDTAWFNEKFQINSDILFNPETKAYNQSIVTLEIKATSKYSNTSYSQSFDLAEIAEKKNIPEKQYSLTGGLIASIELCCTHMESKGLKPLRKRQKSEEKSSKPEEGRSFLMIEKVSFAGQPQKQTGRDTPQFHENSLKQIEEAIDQHPLVLQDPNTQLSGLRDQLHKEIQEHDQTKIKLKSVKQLLENEYNVNRQQKATINKLQKEFLSIKQYCKSLQDQVTECDNECTTLSATINQKQSEIIEQYSVIQEYKEKIIEISKRLEYIPILQRAKTHVERQIEALKKQFQNVKMTLNKAYLSENENKVFVQQLKTENAKLKAAKDKAQDELSKAIKREKQSLANNAKLTQQKDLIKRETVKWRSEFAAQSQRKEEQFNNLQEHYNHLFKRYQELGKKLENFPSSVSKETFEATVKSYEKKIEVHEDKESKFREQLEIIEEEIANMQALLEQKEENQQILLQHIKKLQKDIDEYSISNNWWTLILKQNENSAQKDTQDASIDEKTKLLTKNQQLIKLLQKNSKIILQGEKLKLEMASLKKQNEQLSQKQLLLNDQYKELKQKISSLYKENKKLQDKNAKLNKENELLNKKNLWLQQQITQIKIAEKDARQDYQIISYQLYKIEIAKESKISKINEQNPIFLSVINENSQQFLASSHHLIKESSIKEKVKNDNETNLHKQVYQTLAKLLDQRGIFSQELRLHIQSQKQQKLTNGIEQLKKEMKKVSLSTSKIKSALVRSGNRDSVRQWQSTIESLSSALQLLILSTE